MRFSVLENGVEKMDVPEYGFKIKELPEDERPREKLLKYGAERLSNAELLALIICTGSKRKSAIELSQDILGYFGGLHSLVDISVEEIKKIKGVGIAKGTQISALVELSKRIFATSRKNKIIIKSPHDVANLTMPALRHSRQEVFKIILLDVKNQLISVPEISRGSLSSSIVHPREVFREAIRRSSAALIMVHNHPSGIPEPSKEDINITRRMSEAGKIMGIEVLDHVVIGDGRFVSMKEKQMI